MMKMANEKAFTNLREMPPPNGWQGWPTGVKAAAILNIGIRRLRLLHESGNITRHACPDRTFRFDPDELELLRKDLAIVGKRSIDDSVENDGLDDLEERSRESGADQQTINKTLVEALKVANAMAKEMHEIAAKSQRIQAETYDQIIKRLLEREESREKTLTENYLAREAYFNHQLERDMAAKSAANLEERRNEMWQITKGHLDKLVDIGMAKFGIPKEMLAKLEPAVKLLQNLNPAQLQVLLGSGFLTKEQEDLVKQILTKVPDPDETAAAKVAAECERIRTEEAAKAAASKASATPEPPKEEPKCETPPPEPPSQPQP